MILEITLPGAEVDDALNDMLGLREHRRGETTRGGYPFVALKNAELMALAVVRSRTSSRESRNQQKGEGVTAQRSPIGVSDHALLRFLERGAQLDVEALRLSLAEALDRAHAAARSIGEADYLIRVDGLLFVVRGETVTTVLDDRDPVSTAATLARRYV